MSYRCELCGKKVENGIRMNKVVTAVRDKTGRGQRGMEIAEEKNACADCAAKGAEVKVLQSAPRPVTPESIERDLPKELNYV